MIMQPIGTQSVDAKRIKLCSAVSNHGSTDLILNQMNSSLRMFLVTSKRERNSPLPATKASWTVRGEFCVPFCVHPPQIPPLLTRWHKILTYR